MTGELSIRFSHPVRVDRKTTVTARVINSRPPFHKLESNMSQDGLVLVTAAGKFMERPGNIDSCDSSYTEDGDLCRCVAD